MAKTIKIEGSINNPTKTLTKKQFEALQKKKSGTKKGGKK